MQTNPLNSAAPLLHVQDLTLAFGGVKALSASLSRSFDFNVLSY